MILAEYIPGNKSFFMMVVSVAIVQIMPLMYYMCTGLNITMCCVVLHSLSFTAIFAFYFIDVVVPAAPAALVVSVLLGVPPPAPCCAATYCGVLPASHILNSASDSTTMVPRIPKWPLPHIWSQDSS